MCCIFIYYIFRREKLPVQFDSQKKLIPKIHVIACPALVQIRAPQE